MLLMAALASYAQQVTEPPKYEVASIKLTTASGSGYTFHIGPDGSVAASGITLRRLMMTAYNVQGFRIVGGPDWVSSRRWELQARPKQWRAVEKQKEHSLRRCKLYTCHL